MANNNVIAGGNAVWQMNGQNNMDARKQQDAATWQKMIQMLNAARTTDPSTMVGFALGKLLRGTYDHMMDARDTKKEGEADASLGGSQTIGGMPVKMVRIGFDPNNAISVGTTPDKSIAFGQETKTTPASKMQAYQASAPGMNYESMQKVINNSASNAQFRQGLLGALQKSQQTDPLYYYNKLGNPNATFF